MGYLLILPFNAVDPCLLLFPSLPTPTGTSAHLLCGSSHFRARKICQLISIGPEKATDIRIRVVGDGVGGDTLLSLHTHRLSAQHTSFTYCHANVRHPSVHVSEQPMGVSSAATEPLLSFSASVEALPRMALTRAPADMLRPLPL